MLRLLLFLVASFASPFAYGNQPETYAPDVLKPWIPWVLEGEDRRACALIGAKGERLCAWPGRLHLDLEKTGGLFAQRWAVAARSWVPLPGGSGQWPKEVRVGAVPVAVVEHEGRPAIELEAGDHAISGRFQWSRMPNSLAIPLSAALVSLRLDGAQIELPRIGRDGSLWLDEAANAVAGAERDSLRLSVYRRIEDDNPLRVTTRLDMDVAGRGREIGLDSALLSGGVPMRLNSPLPARLEPRGQLRLQVRPGRWVVEIESHHVGQISELSLGEVNPPWPKEEVWVFAAHPQLRQVEIEGAPPVDPRQTRLPAQWARLPAYLMRPGRTLRLVQQRRGDANPAPDRLSLDRDMWLDFRGTGYTLRDRIAGELTQSWRIQVGEGLDLGQVLVNGEPRFITRLPGSPGEGVEVRQGRLDLVADSRIEGPEDGVPASGWLLDFQSSRTHLHLPPGWDLVAVSGVDNLPDSWLNRWTLLDLFLVLLIALAVAKLWSWGWGAIALVTMGLIWQEPDAPRLVWLNLLAVVALLRLLPSEPAQAVISRLRRLLQIYFRGSLVLLLVIALPFLVGEVRNGIYPQLERLGQGPQTAYSRAAPAPLADAQMAPEMALRFEAGEEALLSPKLRGKAEMPPPKPIAVVDPGARVQTGPGVPNWRWKSLQLSWNGPVPRDHRVDLWLLPPIANLALAFVQLALVVLLALKIAGVLESAIKRAPAVAAVLLAAGLSGGPTSASAQDFPPAELLQELEGRLSQPPDCLPSCADIEQMTLRASAEQLTLDLTVSAAAAVALPVPGSVSSWQPTSISLEGEPVDGLYRREDGALLLAIEPGRWQVRLAGELPRRAQIEIPLPLRPRQLLVDLDGWRVEGIDDRGRPGPQIRLTRLSAETSGAELQPTEVPPLLRVRRTLQLGVDWRMQTQIERMSAPDLPVALDVPLIPGEQVLSEEVRVRDGKALVSLSSGQINAGWTSSLQPVDRIRLQASENPRLSEEWRVDVSPIWHLQAEGLPVIHHQGRLTRWLPTWRPWPGEAVMLTLSRPQGVPGPTLTLDASSYELRPGSRVTEAALELKLRSSQGGEHRVLLPEGAELLRVRVDGEERPLRLEGRAVTLPLVPAPQDFRIEWRQPHALNALYSPPVPDVGTRGVNAATRIELGQDRWVLFTWGPRLGPAVLFWGLVVVLVLLSYVLGRSKITPLTTLDWLLLGLGLSQSSIWAGLLVAGWLFALGLRSRADLDLPPWRYNLIQTGLFLLSLVALSALVVALEQGLLGQPEMQIAGNGSTSTRLSWYQDRSGPDLPQVWVLSVPILVYRGLMLIWALWLAFRLLHWLRWGWQGLSRPTIWREVKLDLSRGSSRKTPTARATGPEPVREGGLDPASG